MMMDYTLKNYMRDLKLSYAEREICECLLTGKSNQEMAQEMRISANTIKTHLYRIYKKIGCRTRHAAIVQLMGVRMDEIRMENLRLKAKTEEYKMSNEKEKTVVTGVLTEEPTPPSTEEPAPKGDGETK